GEVVSGHTPGPWRAVKRAQPIGRAEWEVAWSDAGELVCDVVYHEADARLIAAAPDLLSSHGRLLANFRLLLAGKPVRDVAEMYAEAEAAIAKATGAQP